MSATTQAEAEIQTAAAEYAPTPTTAGRNPTPRIYAKEVRTSTEEWSASNGLRTPRGYGYWLFCPAATARKYRDNEIDATSAIAASYEHRGTYQEAHRNAEKRAAADGHRHITLLP